MIKKFVIYVKFVGKWTQARCKPLYNKLLGQYIAKQYYYFNELAYTTKMLCLAFFLIILYKSQKITQLA